MDMTFWSPNSILRLKLDSQYWYFIVVFSFRDVANKAVVHTGLIFFPERRQFGTIGYDKILMIEH